MDTDSWLIEKRLSTKYATLEESVVKLLRAYGYTREQLRLQYPEAAGRVEGGQREAGATGCATAT